MTDIEFFSVHANLTAIIVDYVDFGDDPDVQKVSATVKFLPRIPNGSLIWAPGLLPPQGIALAPIQARFDTDGWLRTIQAAPRDDKQLVTVAGSPTNYKLAFNGSAASTTIAGNAPATTMKTALEALSTIGTGNVTVGGSDGGPYTVAFTGALAAADQPLLVASAITGGTSPTVTITSIQDGSLNEGVKLVAHTAAIDLDELVYDAVFSNVIYNKADQIIAPFGFVAPTTGGGSIDLASIAKVLPKPGL